MGRRIFLLAGAGTVGRLGLLGMICMIGVSGCAVPQSVRCEYANWEALGARDAARGAPLLKLEAYRNACAGTGVVPDAAAYQKGWSGERRAITNSKSAVKLSAEAEARRTEIQTAIKNFEANIASLNQEITRLQAEADRLPAGSNEQNQVLARQRRLTGLLTEQMGARSAATLNLQMIEQGVGP